MLLHVYSACFMLITIFTFQSSFFQPEQSLKTFLFHDKQLSFVKAFQSKLTKEKFPLVILN